MSQQRLAARIGRDAHIALLREIQRRQGVLNAMAQATLGDLIEQGIYSYAGRLKNPFGVWNCPWCWRDYANRGQYCEQVPA